MRDNQPLADGGMLWLNNTGLPLAQAVAKAVQYFEDKYGRKVGRIEVSKDALSEKTVINGIPVEPAGNIVKHHMLVFPAGNKAKAIQE